MQAKWLVHYVPFALFLGVLAVVYIANGHYADDTIRRTAKARTDLKQLQYEYKTLQAELMYRSKESELVKAVAPLGLKPLTEPPVRILMDDKPVK
jgi:hypothetical protein